MEMHKNKFINNKQEIASLINKERKNNKIQKNYKLKIKRIKNNHYFNHKKNIELLLLIILIIINLPLYLSDNDYNNQPQYYHEENENKITLIVEGKGDQNILHYTITRPDFVIINDKEELVNSDMKFGFNEERNKVELIWKSLLTSCKEMFKDKNCITSIDFSNFNSSKVTDMTEMFNKCSKLKSVNFKKSDTSNVITMECMFCNTPITSLDLSSLDTSKVEKMSYMFYNCPDLKEIDLSNFKTNSVTSMENMFNSAKSLISLDLSKFNTSSVKKMNYMFSETNSLKYINLISFEENEEVEITNIFTENLDTLIYCINKEKSPKISAALESKNYSNNCQIFENNLNSSEIKDVKSTYIIEKAENIKNSENIEVNENDKASYKINESEYDEINVKTQTIERTEIIQKLSLEELFKESNEIIKQNITIKDEMIKSIRENIINRNLDSLIKNISKENEDLLVRANDTLYQITTTNNQKNNNYKNISRLNIRDCEDRLKGIYNINRSLPLIIFKLDYYKENSLIPVICYEIYHPENKSQLDLNYCKDILISLDIPVSIDEDNYFKYDPNSEYYTDECYTYTTDNGTDIILDDRQMEYNEKNYSICENNCTLIGYDNDTKKASCECETKSKISLISEIIEDENIFSNYFNEDTNYASSIITMKCIYTLFTKDGLLTNIGNYILLLSIIIFVISTILFYKCGYHIIETEISTIINSTIKINEKSDNSNMPEFKQKKKKIIKKKKKNKRISSVTNPLKRINFNKNFYKKQHNILSEIKNINSLSSNKQIINHNISIYKVKGLNKKEKINEMIKYENYELNLFNYKEALIYDKRSFSRYYLNLLKIKNIIFFSFYPYKDYNLKMIKICLFFLFFDIYFAANSLFFNESSIHRIYVDKGSYNLGYFMPQIIFSFFISYFISNIIKYFSLSERNLIKLKQEKNIDDLNDKVNALKRCLIIKYIIFFSLSFLFLFLFWFYLSSFCAVYKNSQAYLFKNSIISFSLSLLFPIVSILLPSFLRIYSLKKEGTDCLFKVSKIIEIFI